MNIAKQKKTKKTCIGITFFFLTFLIINFCGEKMYTYIGEVAILNEIQVFHIKMNPLYIIILMSTIFMLISIIYRFKIDRFCVIMLISILLGIIPILYNNSGDYLGNFFTLIIAFLSYYFSVNTKGDFTNKVYKIICFMCLIISFQVIYTEISYFSSLSFANFNDLSVKGYMRIPVGASNFIASFLLPMITFIVVYNFNKYTLIVASIATYALLLCRSKNAIIIMVLYVIVIVIRKILIYIFTDRSISKKLKYVILFITMGILIAIIIYVTLRLIYITSNLGFKNYYSPYTNKTLNFLDSLLSGRLSIYESELKRFFENMLLGNGFSYNTGQARSHNWIIELFVQRGIVGAILYFYCLIKLFSYQHKQIKRDKFVKAINIMCLIMLIQGLFEITLFTYQIDFFLWSMIGFSVARINHINREFSTSNAGLI